MILNRRILMKTLYDGNSIYSIWISIKTWVGNRYKMKFSTLEMFKNPAFLRRKIFFMIFVLLKTFYAGKSTVPFAQGKSQSTNIFTLGPTTKLTRRITRCVFYSHPGSKPQAKTASSSLCSKGTEANVWNNNKKKTKVEQGMINGAERYTTMSYEIYKYSYKMKSLV